MTIATLPCGFVLHVEMPLRIQAAMRGAER